MAICTKTHFRKTDKGTKKVSCYYIAGVCIQDPCHQGGLEIFLRSTYPFYHSQYYLASKHQQINMVPSNIELANVSI